MIDAVLTGLAALSSSSLLVNASPLQARQSGASAYCSDSTGQYQLSSVDAPVLNGYNSAGWNLSIDDTSSGHKQTIQGFGAAVTDATVTNFDDLSSDALNDLLSTLMTTGPANGAGFSLMRHTIGASDLSAPPAYTYDDNSNNADPNLDGFNLGDRGNAMASLLAQMTTTNSDLTILGSPWSAPAWMKLNNNLDSSTTNNNLADGYLQASPNYSSQFAQYFVKYIQAYKALGATINAITIQNEPLFSSIGYPTMYVYDYESAQLIQNYVGPALDGMNVDIWAYDHNTDQPSYPQTVVDNASQYVSTVAWHCYAGSLDWSVLTDFHNSNPNVAQYMTECWTPQGGVWYDAANFTIGPLQNWASGVMAWTLGTDSSDGPNLASRTCTTCEGLVTISNGTPTYTMAYYMMAQFSRFMPRGAIVLSGTGSYTYNYSNGIQSVASLNPDGTRTVVIMNTFGNDVYIQLTTSSGEEWGGNVIANSVTTWVLPAAS